MGRSGRDALELPDGSSVAILRLSPPIAVAAGDRLVVRRSSGTDRIVGAVVLDPGPARGISRRRQTGDRVGRLAAAVAAGDSGAIATARLDLHGAIEATAGTTPGAPALAPDVEAAVRADVLASVDPAAELTWVRAVAARSLRRQATIARSAAVPAGAALVDRLIADGRLVRDGPQVRQPGSERSGPADDPALMAAMDRLERSLAVAAPPPLAEAARAAGCPPEGVRAMEREGRIVVLESGLAYATTTYREIAAAALTLAARGPVTPAALRDATGTSRKYVMAILADLDRRGVLRRTPDGHLPGPKAAAWIGTGSPR